MSEACEPHTFGDEFTTGHAHLMLDYYARTLTEFGYRAEPYPDVEGLVGAGKFSTPKFETMNHALWMCDKARDFLRDGRMAKAYRWIGTIQGILLMNGLYSIVELKGHNRCDFRPVSPRGK